MTFSRCLTKVLYKASGDGMSLLPNIQRAASFGFTADIRSRKFDPGTAHPDRRTPLVERVTHRKYLHKHSISVSRVAL